MFLAWDHRASCVHGSGRGVRGRHIACAHVAERTFESFVKILRCHWSDRVFSRDVRYGCTTLESSALGSASGCRMRWPIGVRSERVVRCTWSCNEGLSRGARAQGAELIRTWSGRLWTVDGNRQPSYCLLLRKVVRSSYVRVYMLRYFAYPDYCIVYVGVDGFVAFERCMNSISVLEIILCGQRALSCSAALPSTT